MAQPERGAPENGADSPQALRVLGAILAVAIITLALTLYRLGARDVCSGNEAVEGVFVQQMAEHGKYLFPLENGHFPMYKPPLFHWTAAAIDRIAGITKVTAFNLRLPSVLYAAAGAILAMMFAYDLLGLSGAVLAGLTLAGSYQYISQGRFGRVDMTLTFFEALSLFSFFWWIGAKPPPAPGGESARGSIAMQYVLAAALGMGVLAKGPVGAILPLAAMGMFIVAQRRVGETIRRISPLAVIVAVAIASSWYLACYFGGRYGFLDRQIGSENFGRFFGSLGAMKPWYYLVPILFNSAPLSLFVPVAVALALGGGQGRGERPKDEAADCARQAVRLLAIFWIVTVVFFSIAAYKRRSYLLPLWPPSAVMLAWLVKRLARRTSRRIVESGYLAICIAAVVFNFVFIPKKEARECGGDSFRPAAQEITRLVAPDEPLYSYGFTEELAPLLFYLDRDAPELGGRLGDAPPGYVIVPASVWARKRAEALDLEPVLESSHGNRRLILLRRGKLYAAFPSRRFCGSARSSVRRSSD